MPEVIVPDAQLGLVAMDSQSLFIKANSLYSVVRVAKPGCTVPAFEQPVGVLFGDQDFVSDGQYVAWLNTDLANPCTSKSLTFCDPANCQPQVVPVPSIWPEQGAFSRLALGPGYLYFTMRNGLVARMAKGSTVPEQIWTDPANQSAPLKRGQLLYPALSDGRLFVERSYIEDAGMDVCMGNPVVNTGTIWSSDPTPAAIPQPVAENLGYLGALAVSQNYVYVSGYDSTKVMSRVLKKGGPVETMNTNGNINGMVIFPTMFVVKGWLYFKVGLPNNGQGIARFPAESAIFTADTVEILVEGPNLNAFRVDDDALYWDDCIDQTCTSRRILARVMTP